MKAHGVDVVMEPEVIKVTVPESVRKSNARSGAPPPEQPTPKPKAPEQPKKPSDALKDGKEGKAYEVHDLAELLASTQEPPPWMIEGLLSLGGIMVLSGRAKTNKTWVALDLAKAVATGKKWLGRRVKRGVAVYVNLELSKPILGYRLNKLLDGVNLDEVNGKLIPVTIKTGLLGTEHLADKVMSQITRAVGRLKPTIYIIDSFYNLAGDINENDIADVTDIYRSLQTMLEEQSASAVMIHHFAKGDPSTKMGGDRAGGSRAHGQAAEAVVEVTPQEDDGCFIISAEVRAYRPVDKEVWSWDETTFTLTPEPDKNPDAVRRPPSKSGRPAKLTMEMVGAYLAEQSASRSDIAANFSVSPSVVSSVVSKGAKLGYFNAPVRGDVSLVKPLNPSCGNSFSKSKRALG